MKKLLILLAIFAGVGLARSSQAQCTSYYGCMSPAYYWDAAAYTYFWDNATNAQKAAFTIDNAFGALFTSLDFVESSRILEQNINLRRDRLENYKSVKAYYTEGIPPFADRGPDGRPRSPKITWQDVESIGMK